MWKSPTLALAWACLSFQTFAGLTHGPDAAVFPRQHPHALHVRYEDASVPPLLDNPTASDIDAARKIVKGAIVQMTKLNKARLDKPARNRYKLKPSTVIMKRDNAGADDEAPPLLLDITPEIARAAALVADVEAANSTASSPVQRRAGTFWMEHLERKGTIPWGDDGSYKVFRNVVTDYGADPSGKTDSTAAIQKAISDGKRCGAGCNGSTTKNAIVYFPSGTYLVSSSISIMFGTQIIGDANNWPIIKGASSFVGLGVLSTDVYVDGGGDGSDGNALEWYINTGRFYSQIRNIRVDITATDPDAYVCAVHYQVAQATSIQNVELIATTGTTQQGMFSENGSGGVMSDVTFTGGNFGFYGGNQQFSATRMTFKGCATAVQLIWDWGWVWKSVKVDGADVGFRLVSDNGDGNIGSVSFMDSTFSNIKTSAIIMGALSKDPGTGTTGLILDNVRLGGNVADNSGNQLLASGYYKSWVVGPVYQKGTRTWKQGPVEYAREKTLLGAAADGLDVSPYFERKRAQYEDKSASDFVHLKDGGAKGDGKTDDTAAVQDTLSRYGDGSKIIFVDSGTYILTDTVTIPKDTKIVGEAWSQFAANGDKFSDPANPRVMLKVGKEGDVGSVEMQDLILTTKGSTAGAVLMEWNVKAKSAGQAAMWDVHARVGGAAGTGLTPAECPPITTGTNPTRCNAASLLLHITPKASGYFDNMWLWVADHMIDDDDLDSASNDMTQVSVYSARGFLVESTEATWLYGTSSEHSIYYQYNFHNARNIFTTMIQTESPYYQPTPKPPAPFANVVGKFPGDPSYSCKGGDFDGCDESWAVVMEGCQNIHIGSAGTYSWFSTYTQDCIDGHTCQKTLWWIDGNHDNNRLQHVIAIGAKNILVANGKGVLSTDNLAIEAHPAWAQISIFDVPSNGPAPTSISPAPSDDDQCDANDRTYSNAHMPDGEFFYMPYLNDSIWPLHEDYYITIVNLTPNKFVLTYNHSCGISPFEFGDIPPGKARQNKVSYTGKTTVDDNGEAHYSIEGTGKTFMREYRNPYQTSGVTLVITGSDDYGYVSSLTFQPYNWMRGIYHTIKDRQLRHVVMPGSHDAGMSTIGTAWQGAGVKSNTQTQSQTMYNQLRVGSRYFDMRLVSIKGGTFYAAHLIDELATSPYGAIGAKLDDMIDDVNRFTDENPGEVIIWWIKYMVNVGEYDPAHGRDAIYWTADRANDFLDTLEKINNRCSDLDPGFDVQTAGSLMDRNDGKGCVLLLTDGDVKTGSKPIFRTGAGIYHGTDYMGRDDYWAQETTPQDNSAAQINRMHGVSRDNTGADKFFIMQWQCTPDFTAATAWRLENYAVKASNPALYWDGVNAMSPESFPTVILQDYIGQLITNRVGDEGATHFDMLGAEIQTLAIGLNLYMVSQNCKVSPNKNPLLKVPHPSADAAIQSRADGALNSSSSTNITADTTVPDSADQTGAAPAAVFTGVIFANGTVDQHPPKGFHLGVYLTPSDKCSNDY